MVLKLKCTDNNLKDGEFNEWVYFDKFTKIKTSYFHREKYLNDKIPYNYCQIDKSNFKSDLHEHQYLMRATLFDDDFSKGYMILFNTFGYLLNDQGKTIEKLN